MKGRRDVSVASLFDFGRLCLCVGVGVCLFVYVCVRLAALLLGDKCSEEELFYSPKAI